MPRRPQTPKNKGRGRRPADEDSYNDEVDDFMEKRDRVMFSQSDDENASDSNDEEQVLGFDSDSDDDDDDDDEVDDADENDDENVHWGKKKGVFYQSKEDNEGDEEAELEEEREARRIQQQQARRLAAADFGEDDLDDEDEIEQESEDDEQLKSIYAQVSKEVSNVSIDASPDDLLNLTGDNVAVERFQTNRSKLSVKEKLTILENEAPELVQLLTEFKSKIEDVRQNVQPLLDRVQKKELPTSNGVSFLEVKFHLLLNYCINICFYLLLKADGRKIQDHPVITQLVKLRVLLEKLQPIDKRLKYQVDKLIRQATVGIEDNQDESASTDALQFRPNLTSLETQDESDDGIDDSDKVYRAPKNIPMHYDELDKESQSDKKQRKQKERAMKSSMMKIIRETYTDAPEELSATGVGELSQKATKRKSAEDEQQEFEERSFIRLPVSTKERRRREREMLQNGIDDTEDYGDIAQFVADNDRPSSRNAKPGRFLNELEKNQRSQGYNDDDGDGDGDDDGFGDFDDMPQSGKLTGRKRKAEDFIPLGETLQEDPFYEAAERQEKRRKKDNKQRRKQTEPAEYLTDTLPEGEKRDISWQIMSNKGLTPHRKKEVRNPRKKLRNKFDKATKRRQGAVRNMRSQDKPYEGEATGIRRDITRSIRLK